MQHEAKKEMERMRKESRFVWKHPLTEISGYVICLFNIRSWKAHIHHFLSDPIYTERCALLCFTEKNLSNQSFNNINKFMPGWVGIHKLASHGLGFDTEKVKIIREYQVTSALEVLPVLMGIDDETVILVGVYRIINTESYWYTFRAPRENIYYWRF